MGCIGITLSCHLDFRLTGRQTPRAVAWNAGGVYENLKWMATPDGGYIYPSGQDWALFRNPQKAHLHLLMATFEGDADGWSLAENGWDAMVRMQARSEDGRVFLPGEYHFASTQHDTISMFALQWLYLHLADSIRSEPRERVGTRHLKSGGLVLQRTTKAFVTLSYGAKVMAQVAAMRPDRVVSPDQGSLVGRVYVAGQKRQAGPRVARATVEMEADRFTARVDVAHGDGIMAHLLFRTEADGTLHVKEELVAVDDATVTRVATGLIGILNNPRWIYEDGARTISLDGTSSEVPAHSGILLQGEVNDLSVDNALYVRSSDPLAVRYEAAKGPERGRATDRLYLNYRDGVQRFKAGETISEFAATIRIE
jgi:hypothetical protein